MGERIGFFGALALAALSIVPAAEIVGPAPAGQGKKRHRGKFTPTEPPLHRKGQSESLKRILKKAR